MENDDTLQGGESLTIDQATAAFVKATTPPAVQQDHVESEDDPADGTTTDEELQPGDEPEGEETNGETGDEDETGTEEGEDVPESDGGRFAADNAKTRLPDGTVTTLAELKSGYLKNADATKKWQEAADIRKSGEAQSATVKALQEQVEQRERYATQIIQHIIGDPPSLSMLDPASPEFDILGYNQRKANSEAWQQVLHGLQQQDTQSRQQKTEEQVTAEREKADSEWNALLQVKGFEHLKDAAKAEAFAKGIGEYLTSHGATQEHLRAVALNHEFAVIVDKARRYDKLQASKATVAKKVEGRPPVQKGGKRLNPNEARARAGSDAMNRLKETGSEADAVAAYLATRKTG